MPPHEHQFSSQSDATNGTTVRARRSRRETIFFGNVASSVTNSEQLKKSAEQRFSLVQSFDMHGIACRHACNSAGRIRAGRVSAYGVALPAKKQFNYRSRPKEVMTFASSVAPQNLTQAPSQSNENLVACERESKRTEPAARQPVQRPTRGAAAP